MKKFNYLISKAISNLENSPLPVSHFFISFLFILIIRNFLEVIAYGQPLLISDFFHFNFSFLWVALNIIYLIYFIAKDDIIKISKVVLPSFVFIWLGPIFDILFFKKKVFISYYFPKFPNDLLLTFLTFFGSNSQQGGASLGLRIEIFFALISVFYFSYYIKKLKVFKSILLTFLIYVLIFILSIIPYISDDLFNLFNLGIRDWHERITDFYYFQVLFYLIAFFWIADTLNFKVILKNLRYSWISYYIVLFFFGIFLGFKLNTIPNITNENILEIIYFLIGLFFSYLFITLKNIDGISDPTKYSAYGYVFLSISLLYSARGGLPSLLTILVFIGLYYIYSFEPLKLKRIPFISKLILSQCSFLIFIHGYGFTRKFLTLPPPIFLVFFLVILPLGLNFIDFLKRKNQNSVKKSSLFSSFSAR